MRNDNLLHAIRAAGYRPGPQFADRVGISYASALQPYLKGTKSPRRPDGSLHTCALSLCDFLGLTSAELWPDEQPGQSVLDAAQCVAPEFDWNPEAVVADRQLAIRMGEALRTITRREALILRLRYGISASESALDEITPLLRISRARIAHIEAKALRKLRHPERSIVAIARDYGIALTSRG